MSGRARHRKPAVIGAGAMLAIAAAVAGFTAFTGTDSEAAENCAGLNQALQNNLNFIAGQKANPDALSDARIANRQAVVDLINQRRATAGCTGQEGPKKDNPGQQKKVDNAAEKAQKDAEKAVADKQGDNNAQAGQQGNNAQAGQQVCNGSTVTLSGEGGAPAASSNQFPAGTKLKVTNLDNNKSTTVEVKSVSGSCVLLNNAAFEQVREPGKFLIRRAKIEKVG
ncbi:hypothetical protein Lesp02_39010 [Lentzea sp. NBRC 105346]|uniref:hypothetical protein n=1 Tax=Lentzea sp. NBRC 105346 TaxID=3032205 RepID=UPI0024A41539|nr:hypothetical protein [Lentzea sp. NBRC 105346]GLZ31713.1 hypothetical protein Lesp02_39010 [Lentzea sp. NBRC 105346]